MKFSAPKENLLYGINAVQRAISVKNTVPILSGIYLKAKDKHLVFAATDLEIAIECTVPALVIDEGEIVLPGRYLAELTRRLPDGEIIFEYQPESVSMKITYENAESSIKGWLGEEFPTISQINGEKEFSIIPSDFISLVKQTSFCANKDDIRPVFTGALIEVADNTLNMVTTDSYRLSFKQINIQNPQGCQFNKVVPVKALEELSRIVKDDDDDLLTVTYNQNQMSFSNSEIRFITRLIDSTFPDYNRVIPKNYQTLIKFKKRNLQNTIDRATLFISERDGSNVIKMNIDNDNINITSQSDYGKIDENLPIYQEGDNLSIAFNARYLTDAFKNMDYEDLEATFSGSLGAAVFRGLNDSKYLYLILPLRS